MDLTKEVEIQRCHAVVIRDAGKEVHKDKLAVAFASIARFLVGSSFRLCPALDNDDGGCATAGNSYQ